MRTALPSISVIVPCYNAERYIGATLRSVYEQQWPELEVIVVDDGSSDHSVALVARQFPQVILVRQINSGVAAARNNGISRAKGELVAFVDADDYWLPGKLCLQWQALAEHGSARMAYGAWVVWESTEPGPDESYLTSVAALSGLRERWSGPSGWIYPQLLLDSEVWTSTVLAFRSLYDEIGVFDTELRIGEDYDLWLRASRVTEILRIAQPTALYRMHGSNITRKAPTDNHQARVIMRALARWGYDSPDGRRANPVDVDHALARTWRNFASSQLVVGDHRVARSAAAQAVRHDPAHAGGWKILLRSLLPAPNRSV